MVEICPLYAQSLQYFYHEGMLDRDKDFSASNEIMCIFHIIMGVCFPTLRDLFVSFNRLLVFSWTSLQDLFIFFLRTSVIFISVVLRYFSWFSPMLEYSGSSLVGYLGSSRNVFPLLLLIVFFH